MVAHLPVGQALVLRGDAEHVVAAQHSAVAEPAAVHQQRATRPSRSAAATSGSPAAASPFLPVAAWKRRTTSSRSSACCRVTSSAIHVSYSARSGSPSAGPRSISTAISSQRGDSSARNAERVCASPPIASSRALTFWASRSASSAMSRALRFTVSSAYCWMRRCDQPPLRGLCTWWSSPVTCSPATGSPVRSTAFSRASVRSATTATCGTGRSRPASSGRRYGMSE
ncbi:hypothetical protein BJF85_02355 [Saccharomonospora sp. CUA-673]|nr:hypothetical protein [Saccharomonospora sp. CUA-673]OLT45239.1 hypothetical protein BJF85_02355 [Saccharomonospora sp. CUA-673]